MKNKEIQLITIERLVSEYKLPHIGNDVVLVETLKILPQIVDARRMSLCIFLGVCTEGVASLAVNDRKRIASRNHVVILTDESVIDGINFTPDFDGIGFFMSYNLLQEILKDITNISDLFLLTHNYPVFEIRDEELRSLQSLFERIRERERMLYHKYRKEVVRLLILTMIYDMGNVFDRVIDRSMQASRQSRAARIFVEYVQLVERNFRQQRQVQWYAAQMGLSPKYLCEAISGISRRSPNEWIDKFVTTEIRNLLRHTDKRISEIAADLNFPTQSFLGKYFKDNVGVSPTDYRNGIEKL